MSSHCLAKSTIKGLPIWTGFQLVEKNKDSTTNILSASDQQEISNVKIKCTFGFNKYCKMRRGTETASIPITIYLLFMERIICRKQRMTGHLSLHFNHDEQKLKKNKDLCLLRPCDWINLRLSSSVQLKSLC